LKNVDAQGSDAMPKIARLLDSILHHRSRNLAKRIAEEVSQRCDKSPPEWWHCGIQECSIEFLRGYVRAKLAVEIRLETDDALRRHDASPELQPLVITLATKQLVELTIGRILEPQADSIKRRMAA